MSPENPISPDRVMEYAKNHLVKADTSGFGCIDDRNPDLRIKIPGAVYGIIDTLKKLGLSEEEARKRIVKSGLLPDVHTDDHNGVLGCAYARTIQEHPELLDAENVPAQERYDFAIQNGGRTTEYKGTHNSDYAIINNVPETTLDSLSFLNQSQTNLGSKKPLGSFDYDRWFMPTLANLLQVDPQQFTELMDKRYQLTLTALGVTQEQILTIE